MRGKIINSLLFICGLSFWWQARLIVAEVLVNSAPFELGRVSLYVFQLLLFVTTVALVADWFVNGRRLELNKKWYVIFSAFIIYLVGRTIFSEITILDFSILYQWLLLLLFLFGLHHYSTKKYLILGVLTSGLILSVWSWGQWLFQVQLASTWLGVAEHYPITAGSAVVLDNGLRFLRAYAGLSHPNILGGYLVIIFLIALNYLAKYFESENKYFVYSYLLFIGSALMLTFSRSALIALVVGLVIWSFNNRHVKNIWKNMGVIIIGLCLVLVSLWPLYFNRLTNNNYLENKSVAERAEGYSTFWPAVENNFIFGLGFSGYQTQLIQNNPNLSGYEIQPVHNAGLFLLAQIGFIGVLLFLLLVIFSGPSAFLIWPLLVLSFFDHYLVSYFAGLVLLFFVLVFSADE